MDLFSRAASAETTNLAVGLGHNWQWVGLKHRETLKDCYLLLVRDSFTLVIYFTEKAVKIRAKAFGLLI